MVEVAVRTKRNNGWSDKRDPFKSLARYYGTGTREIADVDRSVVDIGLEQILEPKRLWAPDSEHVQSHKRVERK